MAQANRYEPRLTESALDFARHYGCSMLPARAYYPQDKAKVELSVQLVERWILARLRKQRFDSVQEVNEAIPPLLTYLNERACQKMPGCRASVFAQIDLGFDGAAHPALGMGRLQDRAGAYRQPRRV